LIDRAVDHSEAKRQETPDVIDFSPLGCCEASASASARIAWKRSREYLPAFRIGKLAL